MPKKLVDVFDREGGKLFTYAIALEDDGCLDAEFEEVALIFAESSGLFTAEDVVHLRARCDAGAELDATETATVAATPERQKSTVVSLIKHRMKRAAASAARHRFHQVS